MVHLATFWFGCLMRCRCVTPEVVVPGWQDGVRKRRPAWKDCLSLAFSVDWCWSSWRLGFCSWSPPVEGLPLLLSMSLTFVVVLMPIIWRRPQLCARRSGSRVRTPACSHVARWCWIWLRWLMFLVSKRLGGRLWSVVVSSKGSAWLMIGFSKTSLFIAVASQILASQFDRWSLLFTHP